MVSVNDSYSGNHLKCADLKGKDVSLVIASTSLEKVGDDHKLVVYFRGTDRDLVLNKTNANCIAQMYGDETDNWAGRKITIIPTQTEYAGKTVPAIRIKLMPPPVQQVVDTVQNAFPGAEVAPTGGFDDMDGDEIPF